jgi:flagellar motor switch protein FliM
MEDRGGRFSIMLPHSTLEPIRALLLQRFIGEKMGRDQGWATSLMTSVRQVPIELRAVVGERTMRLGEAFGIAVGDTIAFSSQAGDAVQLLAEDVELSRAELFCRADRYVVRLAPHQEHD